MTKKILKRDDLVKIKNETGDRLKKYKYTIQLCGGAGCISSDCPEVKEALEKSLMENGLTESVLIKLTGCIGTCAIGPVMIVEPDIVFYTKLEPSIIPKIVTSHFLSGTMAQDKT